MSIFVWPVRVYYEDTDTAGVVYYANYLRFMERARTEWLRELGFEQDVLMRDEDALFAVRRVEIDYLKPARFNDRLEVTARITGVGRASIAFEQEVRRAEEDQALLSRGTVTIACLSVGDLKPKRIPQNLREAIERVR